ncbi:hypothetical protein DSO57_1036293 [Entomophthora muscae]|uniref:Uncharacterized protein n=1 Tax=Entomophthora muscae TaxID=34485 RepID=A0ACC2RE90_9FUNG|nr:hypothetical protein DSO57_1036293 [Entomophthora muscae]
MPQFVLPQNLLEQKTLLNNNIKSTIFHIFLLTRLLIPYLAATPDSKVINLTSCLAFATSGDFDYKKASEQSSYDPMKNYCVSKNAIVLSTLSLREKLSSLGVSSFIVHPGFVSSGHYKACAAFHSIATFLSKLKIRLPSQGTTTIMFLALTPNEELANYSKACYYSDGMPILPVQKHCNKELREDLWEDSCCKVGLCDDI